MKIKCNYCRAFINDYDEKCPFCGAENENLVRKAPETPHTIEELKQWYIDRNLPDENTTRFFIGKNYQGARAFGIYKDDATGNFVVYKNKSDGSRAVRYEGKDESYAVNELYIKLKEEIVNQKNRNASSSSNKKTYTRKRNFPIALIIIAIYMATIIIPLIVTSFMPKRGYYSYGNDYYYYQSGSWYLYNALSGWGPTTAPSDLKDNYSDYYESSSYSNSYGTDDFRDSGYYKEYSSSSSDSSWDSSSDWDSGSSWDSGGTDWDSDW